MNCTQIRSRLELFRYTNQKIVPKLFCSHILVFPLPLEILHPISCRIFEHNARFHSVCTIQNVNCKQSVESVAETLLLSHEKLLASFNIQRVTSKRPKAFSTLDIVSSCAE